MPRYLWFGLSILARTVSVVAALYSDWIWHKLVQGAEATIDFLQDLCDFGHWLAEELAGRWSGYHPSELNY